MKIFLSHSMGFASILFVVTLCPASVLAQDGSDHSSGTSDRTVVENPTITPGSPCFDPQPDSQSTPLADDQAVKALPQLARFWLTEDVAYIIDPQERCVFLQLKTDQEREQFVEQFWLRRNSERSLENPFKEEHYRRIVFANDNFATQIPGWKTDRGRVYITLGPPDSIESRARTEKTVASQRWHFGYLPSTGASVDLDFADQANDGNYRLLISAQRAEAVFRKVPSMPTVTENGGAPHQLEMVNTKAPAVTFRDLNAIVASGILRDEIGFSYQIQYARETHASTGTRILIDIPSSRTTPRDSGGKSARGFEVYVRITGPTDRITDEFNLTIPPGEKLDASQSNANQQVEANLAPGLYHLAIATKEIATGKTSVQRSPLCVPAYDEIRAR
jgi:GWxTD domain-containing protein